MSWDLGLNLRNPALGLEKSDDGRVVVVRGV